MENEFKPQNENGRCVDIHIATLPRQMHVLKTVESLLKNPEVLTITIIASETYTDKQRMELTSGLIALNRGLFVPIRVCYTDDAKGSNEKLKYLDEGFGDYICLADDDCVYPDNYLQTLIQGVEKHQAHVSLHGVCLHDLPIKSYYRDRDVYRGLGTVMFDMPVDIAASCMTMFKREWHDDLDQWYDKCSNVSMDDIHVSYFHKLKGIPRYVLAHKEGFVKHKPILQEDNYVFDRHARVAGADKPQTDFINKYWNV